MPYGVHEKTYGIAPVFLWQPLNQELHYNHRILVDFHKDWAGECYRSQQSLYGWLKTSLWKIITLWLFFIGIFFTPFMAAFPKMWRRRRVKFALGICGLMILALLTETFFLPHYAAPVTCLIILLVVEAIRQARLAQWRGKAIGQTLRWAIVPALLLSAITSLAVAKFLTPAGWHLERAQLLRELEGSCDRHVILVRYGKDQSPHCQWIYNKADIDGSKVVWAWEMGPAADKELIDYFKERQVWLLRADQSTLQLSPYTAVDPTY